MADAARPIDPFHLVDLETVVCWCTQCQFTTPMLPLPDAQRLIEQHLRHCQATLEYIAFLVGQGIAEREEKMLAALKAIDKWWGGSYTRPYAPEPIRQARKLVAEMEARAGA